MKPQDPVQSDKGEEARAAEGERQAYEDTAPGPAPDPSAAPKPGGRGMAWLALLVALLAVAIAGFLAWQRYETGQTRAGADARWDQLTETVEQVRQDTATALQRANAATSASDGTTGEVAGIRNQLTALQDRLESLQSSLASLRQEQEATRAQSRQFSQRLDKVSPSGSIRQLKLAEAGFLIRSAYQTLALSRNPEAAAQTLEMADTVLADINSPGLQPVRRALQQELQALKAVPAVDVTGLSIRLHTMIRRVPELPLRNALGEQQFDGQAPEASQDQGWWQATRDFLGRYFTVRRTDEAGTGLPAPETLHLLREQLQLKLEQARLALLQTSPELYQTSLQQAAAWVKRYFDTNQPEVQATLEEINALKSADIAPAIPETGAALRALEDVRTGLG